MQTPGPRQITILVECAMADLRSELHLEDLEVLDSVVRNGRVPGDKILRIRFYGTRSKCRGVRSIPIIPVDSRQ